MYANSSYALSRMSLFFTLPCYYHPLSVNLPSVDDERVKEHALAKFPAADGDATVARRNGQFLQHLAPVMSKMQTEASWASSAKVKRMVVCSLKGFGVF